MSFFSFFFSFRSRILVHRTDNSAALIGDNNVDDNELSKDNSNDDAALSSDSEGRQKRWKKCVALKESASDITTQEEYYKFDFQVSVLIILGYHTLQIPLVNLN